jgi:hypothetical protein
MPNKQWHRTGRRGCFTNALWGVPLLHLFNFNRSARPGARGVSRLERMVLFCAALSHGGSSDGAVQVSLQNGWACR